MNDSNESVELHDAEDEDEDITLGQDRFHTLTLVYEDQPCVEDLHRVSAYKALIYCPGNHPGDLCDECRALRTPSFDDDSWGSGNDLERMIHGDWHVWSNEDGWTFPYPGCPIGEGDYWESMLGIMETHGPGTYLIEADWEDGDPWLIVIGQDGTPVPDPDVPWVERGNASEGL